MDEKIEKIGDVGIEKVSGGSLRKTRYGYRVFNGVTNEDFGIYRDYNETVEVAKENQISAMDTWGYDEV